MKLGETIEIYYSTNSCCFYCLANIEELKHVGLLEKKEVSKPIFDCAFCNRTGAFVFQAKSKGMDTIKLKNLTATLDCDNNTIYPELFIVEVN